jgi:D-threo-aldose 1-dehydrogenase
MSLASRGVETGPISLGCAQLGNLHHAISDSTANEIVEAAHIAGIRHFDTAPHYGLGLSERRLGSALRGRSRESFVVSTKVGRILEPNLQYRGERDTEGFDVPATLARRWDFSAEGVRRSISESMERLGLDRIDLALVHDPEEDLRGPGQAMREAIPELIRMRRDGIVGAIGVGSKSCDTLAEFVVGSDIDAVMIAGRYTLLNQDAVPTLLPECEKRSVDVLNAGVFNSGVLATSETTGVRMFDYRAAPDSIMATVVRIAQVCADFGVSLPRAAVEFAGSHPAIRSRVVGAENADQVVGNVGLFRMPPSPPAMWTRMREEGLIPKVSRSANLTN